MPIRIVCLARHNGAPDKRPDKTQTNWETPMRNHILVFTTALVLGACADDQQATAPKASGDANRSVSVGASSLPSTQARAGGGAGFTITKVQSTTLNLTTGQSGSATATCPAGSQVVGGGYQNNGYLSSLYLDTSAPNTTTSWTVHATLGNAVPWATITVYALCIS